MGHADAFADPRVYPFMAAIIPMRINRPQRVDLGCVAGFRYQQHGECLRALQGVLAGIGHGLHYAEVDLAEVCPLHRPRWLAVAYGWEDLPEPDSY